MLKKWTVWIVCTVWISFIYSRPGGSTRACNCSESGRQTDPGGGWHWSWDTPGLKWTKSWGTWSEVSTDPALSRWLPRDLPKPHPPWVRLWYKMARSKKHQHAEPTAWFCSEVGASTHSRYSEKFIDVFLILRGLLLKHVCTVWWMFLKKTKLTHGYPPGGKKTGSPSWLPRRG